MSIETEQYLRLKNKICSDLNVTSFSINFWEKLQKIPAEICLLQNLEELTIFKNNSIRVYPDELADLPYLKHVSLRFNKLKQLPKVLGKLKTLETLNLSNNRFLKQSQWQLLTQLPNLVHLDLSYSLQNLQTLPEKITAIRSLKSLYLTGNRLETLPDSFTQLDQLEVLHCDMNNFKEFPEVLTRLPKLHTLRLPAAALNDLPDAILDLQHIPELILTAKSSQENPKIYAFERLLKNIPQQQFSPKQQHLFLGLIRGNIKVQALTNKQLFEVLNSGLPEYINQALTEVAQRIRQQELGAGQALQPHDKLIIKGKTKGKISELKKRLRRHNISSGTKLKSNTTHVLLGNMPGELSGILKRPDLSLLTEQLLVTRLNQLQRPYLLESSNENHIERVRQLLNSSDEVSILLALELLQGGGFPLSLLTQLFLVYKLSRHTKIKRTIRQIVGQYAPLNFMDALQSRKAIGKTLSEVRRRRNLEYYCEVGQLDKSYLAFYLLERGYSTALFALFNLDTADKQRYFLHIAPDGHLSLAGWELNELPNDFHALEHITHLDISYNKFTEVPEQLFQCKHLKVLYIRGLYHLHQNPAALWKIPHLEQVYIGYNNRWNIKTRPKHLPNKALNVVTK